MKKARVGSWIQRCKSGVTPLNRALRWPCSPVQASWGKWDTQGDVPDKSRWQISFPWVFFTVIMFAFIWDISAGRAVNSDAPFL